nr:EbsA family protein [Lactiplantibacillus plantarum]
MLASSVIVWSWTALVLMAGIILWLEILKFKWWNAHCSRVISVLGKDKSSLAKANA